MMDKAHIPSNEPARAVLDSDPGNRFWYWLGASGRRYIHSVYEPGKVPPLPGAVYVAARRVSSGRCEALACGLFPRATGAEMARLMEELAFLGAEEIHVHLLAASPADSLSIRDDLRARLGAGGARRRETGVQTRVREALTALARKGFREDEAQMVLQF